MNEITHFFTGYICGRILKQKPGQFLLFFIAFAAFIPDIDYIVWSFVPSFPHGVFTHTIIGGLLFEFIYCIITYIILFPLLSKSGVSFWKLFLISIIGLFSHLFLDSFTYYESIADATHHMYFWPIWNFPVHINTIFPTVTYQIRVWVEVIYSIVMGCIIIFYDWKYKKNNPFLMINLKKWVEKINSSVTIDSEKKGLLKRTYIFLGLILGILFYYIIIY